jgi:hypothetical protein
MSITILYTNTEAITQWIGNDDCRAAAKKDQDVLLPTRTSAAMTGIAVNPCPSSKDRVGRLEIWVVRLEIPLDWRHTRLPTAQDQIRNRQFKSWMNPTVELQCSISTPIGEERMFLFGICLPFDMDISLFFRITKIMVLLLKS